MDWRGRRDEEVHLWRVCFVEGVGSGTDWQESSAVQTGHHHKLPPNPTPSHPRTPGNHIALTTPTDRRHAERAPDH